MILVLVELKNVFVDKK